MHLIDAGTEISTLAFIDDLTIDQRIDPQITDPQITDPQIIDPQIIDDHRSRRFSIALVIVTSSVYSRSDPTGIPIAMRVTRTPSGFRSFAR